MGTGGSRGRGAGLRGGPRSAPTRVTVAHGPAPATPDGLTGPELRLAVDGLRTAAATWASPEPEVPLDVAALLGRAVLHGLVHVADRRAAWSGTHRWRQLSGWTLFGGAPAERDPGAFAAPEAMESPGEDLASTVTAVLDAAARPPRNEDRDPRCRLPSKVRFVADILGALPARDCPRLADLGLDPADVGEIDLVYAAGSSASIASIAGHVFVMLASAEDADGGVRQDSYALIASTPGRVTLATAVSGLLGGLPSTIVHRPFEQAMQGYAEADGRDVRRYALNLDSAQNQRFVRRLDELRQGWDRPYAFLTRTAPPSASSSSTRPWMEIFILGEVFGSAVGLTLRGAVVGDELRNPTQLAPTVQLGMRVERF